MPGESGYRIGESLPSQIYQPDPYASRATEPPELADVTLLSTGEPSGGTQSGWIAGPDGQTLYRNDAGEVFSEPLSPLNAVIRGGGAIYPPTRQVFRQRKADEGVGPLKWSKRLPVRTGEDGRPISNALFTSLGFKDTTAPRRGDAPWLQSAPLGELMRGARQRDVGGYRFVPPADIADELVGPQLATPDDLARYERSSSRFAIAEGDPAQVLPTKKGDRPYEEYYKVEVPTRDAQGKWRDSSGNPLTTSIDPTAYVMTRVKDPAGRFPSDQQEEVNVGRLIELLKRESRTPLLKDETFQNSIVDRGRFTPSAEFAETGAPDKNGYIGQASFLEAVREPTRTLDQAMAQGDFAPGNLPTNLVPPVERQPRVTMTTVQKPVYKVKSGYRVGNSMPNDLEAILQPLRDLGIVDVGTNVVNPVRLIQSERRENNSAGNRKIRTQREMTEARRSGVEFVRANDEIAPGAFIYKTPAGKTGVVVPEVKLLKGDIPTDEPTGRYIVVAGDPINILSRTQEVMYGPGFALDPGTRAWLEKPGQVDINPGGLSSWDTLEQIRQGGNNSGFNVNSDVNERVVRMVSEAGVADTVLQRAWAARNAPAARRLVNEFGLDPSSITPSKAFFRDPNRPELRSLLDAERSMQVRPIQSQAGAQDPYAWRVVGDYGYQAEGAPSADPYPRTVQGVNPVSPRYTSSEVLLDLPTRELSGSPAAWSDLVDYDTESSKFGTGYKTFERPDSAISPPLQAVADLAGQYVVDLPRTGAPDPTGVAQAQYIADTAMRSAVGAQLSEAQLFAQNFAALREQNPAAPTSQLVAEARRIAASTPRMGPSPQEVISAVESIAASPVRAVSRPYGADGTLLPEQVDGVSRLVPSRLVRDELYDAVAQAVPGPQGSLAAIPRAGQMWIPGIPSSTSELQVGTRGTVTPEWMNYINEKLRSRSQALRELEKQKALDAISRTGWRPSDGPSLVQSVMFAPN